MHSSYLLCQPWFWDKTHRLRDVSAIYPASIWLWCIVDIHIGHLLKISIGAQEGGRFPTDITMPGCSGPVCRLPINTAIPVTVTFSSPVHAQSVHSTVAILVRGNWIKVARDAPICPLLTVGRCPLVTASRYAFRHESTIQRVPVGTRSTMRFRAYNQRNETVTCFQTRFEIIN